MTDLLNRYRERLRGFFPDLLGVRLLEVSPDRVTAELEVRRELCTVPGILHGGAKIGEDTQTSPQFQHSRLGLERRGGVPSPAPGR